MYEDFLPNTSELHRSCGECAWNIYRHFLIHSFPKIDHLYVHSVTDPMILQQDIARREISLVHNIQNQQRSRKRHVHYRWYFNSVHIKHCIIPAALSLFWDTRNKNNIQNCWLALDFTIRYSFYMNISLKYLSL